MGPSTMAWTTLLPLTLLTLFPGDRLMGSQVTAWQGTWAPLLPSSWVQCRLSAQGDCFLFLSFHGPGRSQC